TGEKYGVGGCAFSDEPSPAPRFGARRRDQDEELPPGVDLRHYMTPVEDQHTTLAWLV
ncbi:unnamed protein product, partial [Rotaria sp. Silwood1]